MHRNPGADASARPGGEVNATFCATLVDEWVRAGITDAVVCPGSRSTPMALAFAARAEASGGAFRLHVHHDERSASFMALGMGVATGRPAVVLTTSGTAAVELHPAAVEAHHAQVPVVLVTADRPPELHGVGAPQTIEQAHLFGGAVRWFHDPGPPDPATSSAWRSLGARAVLEAMGPPAGPVHLNLAFREPLAGGAGPLPPARDGGRAWLNGDRRAGGLAPDVAGALVDAIASRTGVIVAGGGVGLAEPVLDLAAAIGWPVLADPRSGCRLPQPATIAHFDALLRHKPFAASVRPEIVLRLGALPASRALAEWLQVLDAWQVGIEAHGTVFDPGGTLASLVAAEPDEACTELAKLVGVGDRVDGWLDRWAHADAEAASAIREVLALHSEPTEPAIARDVVASLPGGSELVVSSSMPYRDVEWFSAPREGLRIHANRGANGIDGVLSTGLGVALATRNPTAVLLGDVAFLHDANALLGIADRDVDLVVVVVDNDGGGIFEFLPQAHVVDAGHFERIFSTPHGIDPCEVAAAYKVPVATAGRQAEVGPAVQAALAAGGPYVVRACTDRKANVGVHDQLNRAVAAALTGG